MYTLLVFLALGQTAQADKEWLLARLIVDQGLSSVQVQQLDKKLGSMSPSQLSVIVAAYKEKLAVQTQIRLREEREEYEAAVLRLEKMKLYRDYLKGQYQDQIRMRQRETQLMREQTRRLYFYPYPH